MKTYRYLVWHLTKWDGGGSRIRSFILEYISMTFLRFTYLMDSRCRYFFASTLFKQICQKSKSGLSCFFTRKIWKLESFEIENKNLVFGRKMYFLSLDNFWSVIEYDKIKLNPNQKRFILAVAGAFQFLWDSVVVVFCFCFCCCCCCCCVLHIVWTSQDYFKAGISILIGIVQQKLCWNIFT